MLEGELETRAAEVAAARDAAVAQADAAALQSMQERESQLTAMLAEAQVRFGDPGGRGQGSTQYWISSGISFYNDFITIMMLCCPNVKPAA